MPRRQNQQQGVSCFRAALLVGFKGKPKGTPPSKKTDPYFFSRLRWLAQVSDSQTAPCWGSLPEHKYKHLSMTPGVDAHVAIHPKLTPGA